MDEEILNIQIEDSDETLKNRIDFMVKKEGIQHAFCPLCGECLPPTIYVHNKKWKELCKKANITSGLVCPECMAKHIDIKTSQAYSIQSYGRTKPTFTVKDIMSCGDFGELANVVMFLNQESQSVIRQYLKELKERNTSENTL